MLGAMPDPVKEGGGGVTLGVINPGCDALRGAPPHPPPLPLGALRVCVLPTLMASCRRASSLLLPSFFAHFFSINYVLR